MLFYQAILTLFWFQNMCLEIMAWPGSLAGKHIFGPFSTTFRSQNRAFQGVLGTNGASKWPQTASTRAQNACLSTANGPGLSSKNHVFSLFLTLFGPKMGHLNVFWAKQCLKTVPNGVKTTRRTWLRSPQAVSRIFWKNSQSGRILHQGPFRAVLRPICGCFGAKSHHPREENRKYFPQK